MVLDKNVETLILYQTPTVTTTNLVYIFSDIASIVYILLDYQYCGAWISSSRCKQYITTCTCLSRQGTHTHECSQARFWWWNVTHRMLLQVYIAKRECVHTSTGDSIIRWVMEVGHSGVRQSTRLVTHASFISGVFLGQDCKWGMCAHFTRWLNI